VAVGDGGVVAADGGPAQADTATLRRTSIVGTNMLSALTWRDLGWDIRSLLVSY